MSRIARSPLALLAAIVLLRSAGFVFGVLNIDESDFILFGTGIARGMLPYRDIVDIKPPLVYIAYLPAGLFGGMQVWPMRLFSVLWVFATALLLRAGVRRWLTPGMGAELSSRNTAADAPDAPSALASQQRDPGFAADAGQAAAWLYLLSLLCELPQFSGEVVLNLFAALALYLFARACDPASTRRTLLIGLSGLSAALASLCKHQGAVLLVALGGALALQLLVSLRADRSASRAALLGELAALALGFALPWAASFAFYAALDQLPSFIDWVFTRNFQYAGKGMAGSAPARFFQSTLLCCGATLLPWALALRSCLRSARARELWRDPFLLAATLLLLLTWAAVGAGGRFYEHYYLQFAVPLALLGAREAARLARGSRDLRKSLRWALALGCALPALGLTGYSWARGISRNYPGQDAKVLEVSAFLDANSRADETLFVWGHESPLYLLSRRMPGTRYINTSVHMGNFDPAHLPESFDASQFRSEKDVALTLRDLEVRRPDIIVDTAPADIHEWHKIPLRAFPSLQRYIETNYRLIGHPAGADVYRRR